MKLYLQNCAHKLILKLRFSGNNQLEHRRAQNPNIVAAILNSSQHPQAASSLRHSVLEILSKGLRKSFMMARTMLILTW